MNILLFFRVGAVGTGGKAFRNIQSDPEAISSTLGTCFIICENCKQIGWGILKLSSGNEEFVIFQSRGWGGKALRSIQSNPEASQVP